MYTLSDFDKFFNDYFHSTKSMYNNNNYRYSASRAAVDLNEDRLNVAFSVIGHDPKNVEVSLTEDRINIVAKKPTNDKSAAGQFTSDISESLHLSKEYDGTTAKAEIKNGLLLIYVDKRAERKPKKLEIKFD